MDVLLSRCIRLFFFLSKKNPNHPFTIYLQLFSWKPLQKLLFLLLIYYDLDVIVPALQKSHNQNELSQVHTYKIREKKQHYGENTSPTLNSCHIHFLSVCGVFSFIHYSLSSKTLLSPCMYIYERLFLAFSYSWKNSNL